MEDLTSISDAPVTADTVPLIIAPGSAKRDSRKMVRSTLLGKHSFDAGGINVHIWSRNSKFLARGRFEGKEFGETLGSKDQAERALRQLLNDLDEGRFQPAKNRPKSINRRSNVTRVQVSNLINCYLDDLERRKGRSTRTSISSRLTYLERFFEIAAHRRRWSFAELIDSEAAVAFRDWLAGQRVTPNGRAGAQSHLISPRHRVLVLETARGLFTWATNEANARLPRTLANPFTAEVVGKRPNKDPLAARPLDLQSRIALIKHMDLFQLRLLALPLLLPNRRGEWASLMINAVSFGDCRIFFGKSRFDPPKADVPFSAFYPDELSEVIGALVGNREDGPLFASRKRPNGDRQPLVVTEDEIAKHMSSLSPAVLARRNDCKQAYREFLRKRGGINDDQIGAEFKTVIKAAGIKEEVRFHDLRGSINREMKRAGVDSRTREYLCGRISSDVQFSYEGIEDLRQEMEPYFELVQPLIHAICCRHRLLTGSNTQANGLVGSVGCTSGAHLVHDNVIYDLK